MSKTGNVIADAFLKAGMQMEGKTFDLWSSYDDYKFPFELPRNNFRVAFDWTTLHNEVRRIADPIDMEWVNSKNAVNTDTALLIWMKSNTSILRVVDESKLSELYNKDAKERYSGGEANSYSRLPGQFQSGLVMYIEYKVMEQKFVLHDDMRKARDSYKEFLDMSTKISMLNAISDHRDLVEFIPIIINTDFSVSHRSYMIGKTEVSAVSVAYSGDAIIKNDNVMKRLEGWIGEGNSINPKNEYYILANKDDRSKLYLRRNKEDDPHDREEG